MPEDPNPKAHPHPVRASAPSRSRLVGEDSSLAARHGSARRAGGYAELQVASNFSFLRGASHPDELVERAAALGHHAIAITDRNSLAGIVRAHVAAKEAGVRLVVGARVDLGGRDEGTKARRDEGTEGGRDEGTEAWGREGEDLQSSFVAHSSALRACVPSCLRASSLLVYPTSRDAYARLCRLLTIGKRRAPKGECHLVLHDLIEHEEGLLVVAVPPRVLDARFLEELRGLKSVFGDRLSLAGRMLLDREGEARLRQVAALSEHVGVAMVATNDVHMHVAQRARLQDVLSCIRHGCTLEQAGSRLLSNGERYLKPPEEMARLFRDYPGAIARTVEIAERAAFNLDELKYEYPDEVVPEGSTAMGHLRELAERGARDRYPAGVPTKVRGQIEHELGLIAELGYAPYFLTVHEIVAFARSRGILCQGRGAAANSAVCYCLGVTSVDPDRVNLLFERFVSKERDEPPDIDIDFEHERREEVIQHVYAKYGRHRAALVCEVISYRGRSAIREVGKALGLSLDLVDRMAKSADWWDPGVRGDRLKEIGLNPQDRTIRLAIELAGEIQGFPRHLSQHVGGFVITRRALSEMVPVENAAMAGRTVIEWDKDDVDAMGMLKIDCLGLGMLTCIGKALGFVGQETERRREQETERRREQETKWEDRNTREEAGDGECEDVSGSGGVAEGDGALDIGLSRDCGVAGRRAVWIDKSDAAIGGIDSIEHRRGIRERESTGSAAIPADRKGIAERVGDTNGDRRTHRDEQAVGGAVRTDRGDRPRSPGPDPKPQGLRPAPTSSLCLSVSSSLSPLPRYDLTSIPLEDPAVYDMICEADTLGVFQIESRAQMAMSPRLKPRCYYDLVIEVAIVRPGPIQGKMVHPYLRRRNGEERITYPHPDVERVLGRTLGVPLFQEQAMALAMACAGFSAGEADQLRRAMAAWKRKGDAILGFEQRLIGGMLARGYAREFAERCFEQIKGFSGYGFPESHAASFAHLVYASAWIKRYHPAAFCAALLNSQPMGFYAPAQIVQDARKHGVQVREIDVNESGWDCSLEGRHGGTEARGHEGGRSRDASSSLCASVPSCLRASSWGLAGPAVRLGLRLVKGLRENDAQKIVDARRGGPFASVESLWRRSGVGAGVLRTLARADAFGSMGLDRQRALWMVRELRDVPMPLFAKDQERGGDAMDQERGEDAPAREDRAEEEVPLPAVCAISEVVRDYSRTGLSLKAHPVSFLRGRLDGAGATRCGDLADAGRWKQGARVLVAGLTITRQRPSTASGIVFVTLEDETGVANLVMMPGIYARDRRAARHGAVLLVRGRVERQGIVVHVKVERMWALDDQVPELLVRSRDFR